MCCHPRSGPWPEFPEFGAAPQAGAGCLLCPVLTVCPFESPSTRTSLLTVQHVENGVGPVLPGSSTTWDITANWSRPFPGCGDYSEMGSATVSWGTCLPSSVRLGRTRLGGLTGVVSWGHEAVGVGERLRPRARTQCGADPARRRAGGGACRAAGRGRPPEGDGGRAAEADVPAGWALPTRPRSTGEGQEAVRAQGRRRRVVTTS